MRLFILVVCIFALLPVGCKGKEEPPKKGFHGEQKTAIENDIKIAGMVSAVKKAVFDENKSKPVGKALEDYRYFTKREWQETGAKNGTTYVDFFGSLDQKEIDAGLKKDGVVERSVNIKFVVKQDGTCFVGMVTMYDTRNDGNTYPVQLIDIAGVMNALYANAKLPASSVSSDSPWRQTIIK